LAKQIPLGKTFNKIWSASLASNVADGILKTAAPLLAATLTKDPVIISLLAALVMLPWLLFAIPIGGLIDRMDRRLAIAVANASRLVLGATLTIFVATGIINIPLLYLVAFLIGIAEVAYDTASQSLLPLVLKKDQLERGNARMEIGAVTVGEFIGAPISGLLYASAIVLPFISGTLAVGAATVLILFVPVNYMHDMATKKTKAEIAQTGYWEDIRFGINYLVSNKTLLRLVIFTASVGFFFSSTGSTVVLFLTQELGVSVAAFGLVGTAGAIGSIIGSILAPKVSVKIGRTKAMALALLTSSGLTLGAGFAPNFAIFYFVIVLTSLSISIWNILLMSTYHQIIPNELFGRIHGTRRTLVWGMMPIGALLGGILATVSLRTPYFVGGAMCLALTAIGFRFILSLGTLVDPGANSQEPAK
jgi:MFS family permease